MSRYRRKKDNYSLSYLIVLFLIYFFTTKKIDKELKEIYLFLAFIIVATTFLIKFYIKRREKEKYLKSGILEVDKMSGIQFENFLKAHFENLGYKASLTSVTADYGADLVLKKEAETIIVQAKRYNNKVGIKAIQEVIGAVGFYHANKGIVVTNSYFTKNSFNLAKENNIELWDRDTLIEVMTKEYANKDEVIKQCLPMGDHICPWCHGKLVRRIGQRGEFIGCINYPKCRYTKNTNQ